ncbi:MAG: hypothetical protein OXE46_02390 [Chloroflexi bacterium]|nr:hypothetical protein [Chloroflexota bacterium]
MSNAKSTALQNAHKLIERGELEAAQEILAPFLESDADDAAIWWLYAHAVRDSSIGRAALQRVLELDHQYPGARELMQDLNQIEAPHLTAEPLTTVDPTSTQNADIDIDDWEDLQSTVGAPQSDRSSRIGTTVLVTALLLLIVGGVLIATGAIDINQLLLNILPSPQPATVVESATVQPSDSDTFSIGTAVPQEEISPVATAQEQVAASAEPTLAAIEEQQENQPTEPTVAAVAEQQAEAPREPTFAAEAEAPIATATAQAPAELSDTDVEFGATATNEPVQTAGPSPTPAPSPTFVPLPRAESDFAQRVAQLIRDFELEPRHSFLRDSDAGNTLVLQSCALPGTDFNSKVASIMQAVVTLANEIPAELDAVAAGLKNCDDPGATLRIIGSEARLIRDFASGAIDDRDFQREWKQLG